MNIKIQKKNHDYTVSFKPSRFQRITFTPSKFDSFVSICGDFFETRSRSRELRSITKRIHRKKYQLFEEQRGAHIAGIIQRKKLKITWAYLCYLDEQIREFQTSEEKKRIFNQETY